MENQSSELRSDLEKSSEFLKKERFLELKSSIWKGMEVNGVVYSETHAERFARFLEREYESDITVYAEKDTNKTPVKAHKLILMIGSPLFRVKELTTLTVPFLGLDELKLFLKFLYTGQKPEEVEAAMPLLCVAELYQIPDLAYHCGNLVVTKISSDTAVLVYEQASACGNEIVQSAALDYICKNAARMVDSEIFLQTSEGLLADLLKKDSVEVFNEIQMFVALLRWGKAEIQRQGMPFTPKYLRSVLENLITLIRFPQITPTDFATRVATAEILTADEVVSVLLHYSVPEGKRQDIPPGVFNPKPRRYYAPRGYTYQLQGLKYGGNIESGPQNGIPMTKSPSFIIFKVDAQIWIQSMGITGLNLQLQKQNKHHCNYCWQQCYSSTSAQYGVDVKIREQDEKTNLAKKTAYFSTSSSECVRVAFNAPVLLKKDVWYKASYKLTSSCHTGSEYNSSVGLGSCQGSQDKSMISTYVLNDQSEIHFSFKDAIEISQGKAPQIGREESSVSVGYSF